MKDWQTDLDAFLQNADQKKIDAEEEATLRRKRQDAAIDDFLASKVVPCFKQLKEIVEKRGREVVMNERGHDLAHIEIKHRDNGYTLVTELGYTVQVERKGNKLIAYPEVDRYRGQFRQGRQDCTIDEITQEEILQHLLQTYKAHVNRPRR